MYAFLIAALIAIATHQLTQLHAMFVLFAVASPLSFYLTSQAVRWSFFRRDTGLKPVFEYDAGTIEGQADRFYWPLWRARLNRSLVLLTSPLWIIVFLITVLEQSEFKPGGMYPDRYQLWRHGFYTLSSSGRSRPGGRRCTLA